MSHCESIQPLLARKAECEIEPEEAMHVARHLHGCTACRIVLARESRLAAMLEGLEDLPVEEDFAEAVMATLPTETPRRLRPGRTRSRGLKLA